MPDTVYARWKRKLAARLVLLATARHRHIAGPTAATRAKLNERKAQVAEAERVVDRHKPTAPSARRISSAGVELIARFEGCVLHPYQDAVGVWTIGYGHTEGVGPHTPSLRSRAQALDLLRRDLDTRYAPPVAALPVALRQHQFDALVSLVYNCGPGCIQRGTTIGNAVRAQQWEAAANGFMLWTKAGGRVLPGLVYRRQAEAKLFRG